MIIAEESTPEPPKGTWNITQDEPPPPYQGSSQSGGVIAEGVPLLISSSAASASASASARRRFIRVVAVAVTIYLIFGVLTGSLVAIRWHFARLSRSKSGSPIHGTCTSTWEISEGLVREPPAEWTYTILSDPSGLYFLQVDDPQFNGTLTVQYDVLKENSNILTRIHASASSSEAAMSVLICQLQADGRDGILIMPSVKDHRLPSITFTITITLPDTDRPLSAFETRLGNFNQYLLGPLRHPIDILGLHSKIGNVTASLIRANRISVETDEGYIRGSFEASNLARLEAKRGDLHGAISLFSSGSATSEAILYSGSSLVNTTVSLENPREVVGGSFNITVLSSAADARVNVLSAPVNSSVHLIADAPYGSAHVKLPVTYQGQFTSESQVAGHPQFHFHGRFEDPEHLGRQRRWTMSASKGQKLGYGEIFWDPSRREAGNVKLSSIYQSNVLEFSGY